MKKALYIFLVIWLLLPGSSQKAKAAGKVDVELKSEYTVDVCGNANARKVLITINMGTIAREDSLFGFNFEATYDTAKLKFSTPIYINTLAELFEDKGMGFPAGKVTGYAVNFSNRVVYGSRPLIAFLGEYVGKCPDTASVNLSYIEFTDEFKKEIGELKPAIVQAYIKDDTGRSLELLFDKDTLLFDNDNRSDVNIAVALGPTAATPDSLDIVLSTKAGDSFRIDSVQALTNKITILNQQPTDSGLIVRTRINNANINGNEILRLVVRELDKKGQTAFLKAEPVKASQCGCITIFKPDSAEMKGTLDTTTVEEKTGTDKIKAYYDAINQFFMIETGGERIEEVEIYDIRGFMEGKINSTEDIGNIKIYAGGFSDGIHLAVIKTKNTEYKLILIKI